MKGLILKLLTICIIVTKAYSSESSVWSPKCPTSSEIDLIQHPVDCRKFFVCLQGVAYPLLCPYGLNWDSALKKCTTLGTCTRGQYLKAPKYNPLCPIDENPATPTHLADANDCGKFYECQGGFAFHMACPHGQHWSISNQSCEDIIVANCHQPSQKAVGNGQINYACPVNDELDNPILLPHPEDCTKFYKCSFGRSYVISCPLGLHWDVDSSRCESPFVAQCTRAKLIKTTLEPRISSSGISLPSTITSATISTTTTLPSSSSSESSKPNPSVLPICPNNGIKNFGIPGQCDKYFSCSKGKLYVVPCRKGRAWSDALNTCIDADRAGCTGIIDVSKVFSTANKITSKSFSGCTLQPSKLLLTFTPQQTSCYPGVTFLSHPTDCHKFFICDNGKPVEMSCPDGLFFSHKNGICQWNKEDCRY